VIPSTVQILGSVCFGYCESLSSITFEPNWRLSDIELEASSCSLIQAMLTCRSHFQWNLNQLQDWHELNGKHCVIRFNQWEFHERLNSLMFLHLSRWSCPQSQLNDGMKNFCRGRILESTKEKTVNFWN
jgi:hypothetical protein